MGSPIVFHTAPPHPASNARITWSPQLAGGPEASQNGLGHLMPAKLVVRSATRHAPQNPQRGALSVRHGVHHFAPAVHAIATSEVLRVARSAGGAIDLHRSGVAIKI